jgi:tetratricopeptide (TPR) repeat protein
MARSSAVDDHLAEAAGWHALGAHERAAERAAAGLAERPDAQDLLRLLMRAQLSRGALPEARAAADRLAALSPQASAVELLVEAALDLGQGQAARRILADTEAAQALPPAQSALLRARICRAEGDLLAAKVILVTAIETLPEAPALRTLLTEVMVAAGTAADARAVLSHLGQPPSRPAPPDAAPAPLPAGRVTQAPDSKLG